MRGGAEAQPFPEYPSDGKLRSKWPMMPENDYYLIYTSCFRECVVCLYSESYTFIMVFYKRYIAIGSGNFRRKLAAYDEMGRFEFKKNNIHLDNPNRIDNNMQFYPTQEKDRWSKFKDFFRGTNMPFDSLPRFAISGSLNVNKLMYSAPDDPIETIIDFYPASEKMLGSVSIVGYNGYAALHKKLFELFSHDQVLAISTPLLQGTHHPVFSSVPAEIFHRIAEKRVALCQVCCDPYQVEVSEHAQAAEDTGEAAGEADAA